MNKVKLIRILLPLAIILWVFIMYKVFNVVFADNDPVIAQKTREIVPQKKETIKDTIILSLNYPDPFLSNHSYKKQTYRSKRKTSGNKLSRKKKATNWPKITYLGAIQNNSNGKYSANLSIDGKNVILSKGNERNGIKLINVCYDSVIVSYEKDTKSVRLCN
jgi:hypothetical protein